MARKKAKNKSGKRHAEKRMKPAVQPPKSGRRNWLAVVLSFYFKHWKWLVERVVIPLLVAGAAYNIIFGNVNINCAGRTATQNTYKNTAPVYNFNGPVTIVATFADKGDIRRMSLDELMRGDVVVVPETLPVLKSSAVLRDPRGLKRIAENVESLYVAGRVREAYSWALAGYDIIHPIISPYIYRSCTIETVFAKHITAIYLVLAGEAWSRLDFAKAKEYSHTVLGIWGKHVSGDVYAIAAAIEIAEHGGSGSIFCDEAAKRFKCGDRAWLYDYMNRLARWGYLHPVAIDEEKTAYHFSFEEAFGLPKKLDYRGPYLKTVFPTKDGRNLTNGELIVMCYMGFGRIELGYIPDPDGRQLPKNMTATLSVPTAKLVGNAPRPGPKECGGVADGGGG